MKAQTEHRRARNREYAADRIARRPSQRWYNSKRWRTRRDRQLHKEPWCAMCLAQGRTRAASVADHITPHRDDPELFWRGKLQSLCSRCHNSLKQREELDGYSRAPGADGWPSDTRHPFNVKGRQRHGAHDGKT